MSVYGMSFTFSSASVDRMLSISVSELSVTQVGLVTKGVEEQEFMILLN